jgi:hypothetical protein
MARHTHEPTLRRWLTIALIASAAAGLTSAAANAAERTVLVEYFTNIF